MLTLPLFSLMAWRAFSPHEILVHATKTLDAHDMEASLQLADRAAADPFADGRPDDGCPDSDPCLQPQQCAMPQHAAPRRATSRAGEASARHPPLQGAGVCEEGVVVAVSSGEGREFADEQAGSGATKQTEEQRRGSLASTRAGDVGQADETPAGPTQGGSGGAAEP
jgi:hypothetical protein